jgi:hypothetical protein
MRIWRLSWRLWYHLKYDVYYPLFRPAYYRAIRDSNEELLGMIGWIDIDL